MFRVFDENGEVHTDMVLSQRLNAALVGDGGMVQRQYFQPKDPRRKGDWSEVVETSPLRLHLIVDKNKPWLSTPQRAGYLCSVRSRRDYARCLEAIGAMELIPMGTTWTSITQKDVQAKKLAKLKPSTIANIVKNWAGLGGLKVSATGDNEKAKDGKDTLAGHFLRGHAGSVAYVLACEENAQWDSFLGVDRARHTLEAFQKNYSRGICPRMRMAFRQHVHKEKLRFEEASRL